MGFFSWECKGCSQELIESELVRLNGCVGEYDGYGRAGGYDHGEGGWDEPVAWHQFCYERAPVEAKLDETPSLHAPHQGCGMPVKEYLPPAKQSMYKEPVRVYYGDVEWYEAFTYLVGIDSYGSEYSPFNFPRYEGGAEKQVSLSDVTEEDFRQARECFGLRFDHGSLIPENELEDFLAEDAMYMEMRSYFGGRQTIVSTVAHRAIRIARERAH